MMTYPEKCLRGITREDAVIDGRPTAMLFDFHNDNDREDGWLEESINWYDSEDALTQLISQVKENGDKKYKFGIAVLSKEKINKEMEGPSIRDLLDYERQPRDDNIYHGNALCKKNLHKHVKKMVSSVFAFAVIDILTNE